MGPFRQSNATISSLLFSKQHGQDISNLFIAIRRIRSERGGRLSLEQLGSIDDGLFIALSQRLCVEGNPIDQCSGAVPSAGFLVIHQAGRSVG